MLRYRAGNALPPEVLRPSVFRPSVFRLPGDQLAVVPGALSSISL